MSSSNEDLVRMVNQIADFFQSYPEDEAVEGIAGHVRDFWTPVMRRNIAAHVANGAAGLRPLAARALEQMAKNVAVV